MERSLKSGVNKPLSMFELVHKQKLIISSFEIYSIAFIINHTIGTNNAGSIFSALQSLIFKMDSPELKIRNPPIRETSLSNSAVRKDDKYPERR